MVNKFSSHPLDSRYKHSGMITQYLSFPQYFERESISFFKVAILIICFLTHGLFASQKITGDAIDIVTQIQNLTDVHLNKIDFEVEFTQPIDHKHPDAGKFTQRIFLTHRDYSKPVVLWLEGYESGGSKTQEITKILDANQIVVEHRYYGESLPDSIDWQYLTIEQSAADHHRVVEAFKKIGNSPSKLH